METDWHRRMKERWAELGESLGFEVRTEFGISKWWRRTKEGPERLKWRKKRGKADVVWLRKEETPFYYIEVETGGNKKRHIRHNILKYRGLSPGCVTIHFKDKEDIKKYVDLKKKVMFPIDFTDKVLDEELKTLRAYGLLKPGSLRRMYFINEASGGMPLEVFFDFVEKWAEKLDVTEWEIIKYFKYKRDLGELKEVKEGDEN